jgi:VanZ family protein
VDWNLGNYRFVRRSGNDRPVSGVGRGLEHFTAFALVGGAFAIGYRFSLIRLLVLAVFFCGGIELLQVPLPTRHARVSDYLVDTVGACFAIVCVLVATEIWHLRPKWNV